MDGSSISAINWPGVLMATQKCQYSFTLAMFCSNLQLQHSEQPGLDIWTRDFLVTRESKFQACGTQACGLLWSICENFFLTSSKCWDYQFFKINSPAIHILTFKWHGGKHVHYIENTVLSNFLKLAAQCRCNRHSISKQTKNLISHPGVGFVCHFQLPHCAHTQNKDSRGSLVGVQTNKLSVSCRVV